MFTEYTTTIAAVALQAVEQISGVTIAAIEALENAFDQVECSEDLDEPEYDEEIDADYDEPEYDEPTTQA